MKKSLLILCILLGTLSSQAQERWLNPAVNQENREPARAAFFAYETTEAAATMDKSKSTRYLNMEGDWRFHFAVDHDKAPAGFEAAGYDDSAWELFPVPGLFEILGHGDRIYKNVGYSWNKQFDPVPPYIQERNNYTGSYRRMFRIPANWKGLQTFVHIGSATSNVTLWVNGQYVGYSEDSKVAAEFDITPYLKPGEDNLIAMQVMRWCDGSYVEDQDFWRFSGIARECYLYARPRAHVTDLFITPDLDRNYRNGTLSIVVSLAGAEGKTLRFVLTDGEGKQVAAATLPCSSEQVQCTLAVRNPAKWTAETPNLYTLTTELLDAGTLLETIPQRVGFRKVEIKNCQVLVNGKAVYFKGANRHELDPDGGYVVSLERMIQDIRIMKQLNINAVRTCHYPDDPRWYDLCDQYGIYLVAEANVEGQGMGYGNTTLAKNESFALAHMERNQRNVQTFKNHPSVIFWSLGNEAGMGPNFINAYNWIKQYDPSRPVQYERGLYEYDAAYTDIRCPMYADYEECANRGKNPDKPFILCEYAHAMGNSMGGMREYWDLFRQYPALQGGFIWDFVDQGLRDVSPITGKTIFTYGGDYGRYPASDNNFNCNGIIAPDRRYNPHAYEVRYNYRNILTTAKDLKKGKLDVFNEYFFRDLSNYRLSWVLTSDGDVIAQGAQDLPAIAPQTTRTISLTGFKAPADEQHEYLLSLEYTLRDEEPLMDAGQLVAQEQFSLSGYCFPTEASVTGSGFDLPNPAFTSLKDKSCIIASCAGTTVTWNRQTGLVDYLDVDGKPMLEDGYSLVPNFWRAPTDNDFGARLPQRFAAWKNVPLQNPRMTQELTGRGYLVTADYDLRAYKAVLHMQYLLTIDGQLLVTQALEANVTSESAGNEKKDSDVKPIQDIEKSNLFRFGMQLVMPRAYDGIEYYGRGPVENYSDRHSDQPIGHYVQTVAEQFYPYVRPQENGNHTDIRWWRVVDKDGKGLEFYGMEALNATSLNYLQSDLDDGMQKAQRHSGDLSERPFTVVSIDKAQFGLACVDSWGAWPLPEYQLPYGNYSYTFVIRPLK